MRTLLLVFVHGFRGDDDTFSTYPEHLRTVLARSLPKVKVKAIKYPAFETRGQLDSAVARFRNWLQEKVIDLEVENGTPSPMIDPSVHVVLVAHSMGGIVAADTLLSILDDKPVPIPTKGSKDPRLNGEQGPRVPPDKIDGDTFMFPYITGILSYDTPWLGLSPGVFAYSAAGNFQAAKNAYSAISGVASAFGWNSPAMSASPAMSSSGAPAAALPAAGTAASTTSTSWGWGKMAMYAGVASGLGATAAAAYINRAEISMGFGWVSSHLEFVSVLMKIDEMRQRATRASSVPGVGVANFYTILGKAASPSTANTGDAAIAAATGGGKRTFCSLPQAPKSTKAEVKKYGGESPRSGSSSPVGGSESGNQAKMFEAGEKAGVNTVDLRGWWHPALIDTATDEVKAHMSMFQLSTNPRYKHMLDESRKKVMEWAGAWCDVDL